jgi:Tfp pilus assembly protein PilZ
MLLLLARYRNGSELLEAYDSTAPHGGLFLPTRRKVEPGEPVLLDVRLPSLKDHMLVRGSIAWRRRGKRSEGLRAGLAIHFAPGEQAKAEYLLALARGETPQSAQRRYRRLPTELQVGWRVPPDRDRHASTVDDIGPGGAFLRTPLLQPEGTPVVLELVPPGGTMPQFIEGRVAWRRATPGNEGLGIEFRCRDTGGLRRLRELVRRIEQSAVTPAL